VTSESIPPDARPKLAARARVQTDKISGKPVMLYPEGVLALNPTGHAIVSLCTGEATLQAIVAELSARYRVAAAELAPQVTEFLERLRARKLPDLV